MASTTSKSARKTSSTCALPPRIFLQVSPSFWSYNHPLRLLAIFMASSQISGKYSIWRDGRQKLIICFLAIIRAGELCRQRLYCFCLLLKLNIQRTSSYSEAIMSVTVLLIYMVSIKLFWNGRESRKRPSLLLIKEIVDFSKNL